MYTDPNVTNTDNVPNPGGLNAAAAKWTINYFVVGKGFPSSTEVNPEVSVDFLKKQINTEMELVPRKEVTELRLYRVDIPDDVNLVNKANEEFATKEEDDVLRPLHILRTLFRGDPDKKKVQILVRPSPLPSEFLRAGIRWMTRLTKLSHVVVGLGDKRPASTEFDDEATPVRKRRLHNYGSEDIG
jgi:hypothetical protein